MAVGSSMKYAYSDRARSTGLLERAPQESKGWANMQAEE
jgi:hypothetical protein